MAHFLIDHYIKKLRNENRDEPQEPSQSGEQKQKKRRKQVALCEHQLAATNGVTATNGVPGDGPVNEKSPNSEHLQDIF